MSLGEERVMSLSEERVINLSREEALKAYRIMKTIREFEERLHLEFQTGDPVPRERGPDGRLRTGPAQLLHSVQRDDRTPLLATSPARPVRSIVANLITGVRLLLALPAAMAFARPELVPPLVLLALLTVAIVTDNLDGIVARRASAVSSRGRLFDHTTDFLFVTSCLAGAAVADEVTAILPWFIVAAFSQYVLDSYLLYRDKQLRMSFLGRWNGILYFVPVVVIAVSRLEVLEGTAEMFAVLVLGLSYLLILSTVVSIIDRAVAPLRARRVDR